MTFKELKKFWFSDAFRYEGLVSIKVILKLYFTFPGFKYSFWLRLCTYLLSKPKLFPLYVIVRLILQRITIKYGIEISPKSKIDKGILLYHFGGIVINRGAKIGKNLTISHGVTIGHSGRGEIKEYPIIGDNVFIAPGAKIIGGVKIGNNVAIAANCVVTKDIPDNAVVVGIPGKVISLNGSEGYAVNKNS